MLNIAITAGGTSENIDGVRKITNVSTGSLGTFILKSILNYTDYNNIINYKIYYICSASAKRLSVTDKFSGNIEYIEISDCNSVYNAVDKLTKEVNIDLFIHSMAISDFKYSYSIPISIITKELLSLYESESKISFDVLYKLLQKPNNAGDGSSKISSDEDLIMGLTKNPKVIKLIKQNNPNTLLVGFKLLTGSSKEELIKAAKKLQDSSGCDYVLANWLDNIGVNNHKGFLIEKSNIIDNAEGKEDVANMLIKHTMADILS